MHAKQQLACLARTWILDDGEVMQRVQRCEAARASRKQHSRTYKGKLFDRKHGKQSRKAKAVEHERDIGGTIDSGERAGLSEAEENLLSTCGRVERQGRGWSTGTRGHVRAGHPEEQDRQGRHHRRVQVLQRHMLPGIFLGLLEAAGKYKSKSIAQAIAIANVQPH